VPRLTAGHVLLIAIAIIVGAYVILGASDAGSWIIAGGIIAFIAAFIFSLRRQTRPPEKYWRDRPLDLRRSGPRSRSWWDRWRHH